MLNWIGRALLFTPFGPLVLWWVRKNGEREAFGGRLWVRATPTLWIDVGLWPCATEAMPAPIPMRLPCPACGELHIEVGDFATKVHHTHACQTCGNVWRPAVVPTIGVRFLPGFKNESVDGAR